MEKLMKLGPDVIINLSASPYNYAQDIVRNSIVKAHTIKYKMPMLYCNTVGSQTEIVFDGGSLVYDSAGNKVKEMKYFEEDYALFNFDDLVKESGPLKTSSLGEDLEEAPEPVYFSASDVGVGEDTIKYLTNEKNIEEIYHALTLGIRDYFRKMV